MELFPQGDTVDLTHASATDFLRAAIGEIAAPEERNALTTSDGAISQDGINRVRRALFAAAYGDEGLISRMSESTDDNVRGVTDALLSAAPAIAKVRAGMKNGTRHNYDLNAINDAVKKLSALRDQGKPVKKYLQEQSLFGEDSAQAKEILTVLDRYKRAPNKIAAFFKKIASNIQAQGDPRQENLFGKNEPAPLINLIRQAKEEVENNGQTKPLFSKQGEVDTDTGDIVDDKDLTPQQKLLKSFGEKMGVKVVFFRGDPRFHGVRKNGISYLNVNSNKPLGKVFWHEVTHWLKHNNPELYNQLTEAAQISDEQRDAFLEQSERTDLETDEEIDEEIIADQMEDVASRTGLLQNIAGKNRGLIERVVQWLKDTLTKFIDHFRNPQGKLTTNQSIALADEFGQIANKLVDQNGRKIFRYNRRTHTIELADGRNLDSVQTDEDTKYSFAGKKAKTADKESLKCAKQMEARAVKMGVDENDKALRDRIYEATGWFKGKDGKWRFEIPDYRERMNLKRLIEKGNFGKPTRLEEIYDNPELYAAYPQLREIMTQAIDPSDDGIEADLVRGSDAVAYGKKIFFNMDRIFDEMDEVQKTLVHEIQHIIQGYERFAAGGTYEYIKSILSAEQKNIKGAVATISGGKEYFYSILNALNAYKAGNATALANAQAAMKTAEQKISKNGREKVKRLALTFAELKEAQGQGNTKAEKVALYNRLGGEQEARHVEERLDNRNGTPVAHDADALIIYGDKKILTSRLSENKKSVDNDVGESVDDRSAPPSAATADGTTLRSHQNFGAKSDNKGGVRQSIADVGTNSPSESISRGEEPVKYSLAGKKAKTADKSLLRQAIEMEQRGANRDQIFRETGWVKGKDEQWRFEIPDDLTKINFDKLKSNGQATLGEIYFNPKLYAAYPQLKTIHVTFSDKIKNPGHFNPSTNTIALNKELARIWSDKVKGTLTHEIQHAIQKIEGFAFGDSTSNPDYKNLGGEQEAREVAARADMSEEKRRVTTPTVHDENAVIIFAGKKRDNDSLIDSNDNSTESLKQKIKNKMSAYFEDKKPTARRNKIIKDTLQKITGYRILFGHTKSDTSIIDDFNKLIQAKHAYEWEKLLPQIGGKIAQSLKLNPNSELNNYIADWLLTGALNNTSPQAKDFQKAMRENPEVARLMQDVRNIFQEFADMTPLDWYKSKIVHREKKSLLQRLWGARNNLIEQFFDDLHPVKRAQRQIENISPEVAALFEELTTPYEKARLVRGKGSIADLMIKTDKENIEAVRNALRDNYPFVNFDRFKSLAMIIEEAGGEKNLEDFEAFCVAKLDKEICEYNRAHLYAHGHRRKSRRRD